jgi:hypothetical protein
LVRIPKKIIGYSVKSGANAPTSDADTPVTMCEAVERGEVLIGATYKIKAPNSDHAMYITINDVVVDPGTLWEARHPFEIFINSKDVEHFQWVTALTRVISAVFRKGGDVRFLAEELKSIFDPKGGHFKKGVGFVPSVVAEIGMVIEEHLARK